MTAAAAATAIVREAAASAVVDVLEGASEEEKAAKMASIKQEKMRKVIRCFPFFLSFPKMFLPISSCPMSLSRAGALILEVY